MYATDNISVTKDNLSYQGEKTLINTTTFSINEGDQNHLITLVVLLSQTIPSINEGDQIHIIYVVVLLSQTISSVYEGGQIHPNLLAVILTQKKSDCSKKESARAHFTGTIPLLTPN